MVEVHQSLSISTLQKTYYGMSSIRREFEARPKQAYCWNHAVLDNTECGHLQVREIYWTFEKGHTQLRSLDFKGLLLDITL